MGLLFHSFPMPHKKEEDSQPEPYVTMSQLSLTFCVLQIRMWQEGVGVIIFGKDDSNRHKS